MKPHPPVIKRRCQNPDCKEWILLDPESPLESPRFCPKQECQAKVYRDPLEEPLTGRASMSEVRSVLGHSTATSAEIACKLGIETRVASNFLTSLRQNGQVEVVGYRIDPAGHRLNLYQLTPRGAAHLDSYRGGVR